ncbi:3-deoxy-7-phosphoheptulonate synthase [Escherichia coli]
MQKDALNNVHITDEQVLMTPEQLKAAFPLSLQQEAQIADSRKTISDIIAGRDPRLLVHVVLVPLSDPETALEYARRFKALAAEVSDSLYLVMPLFEKPRTTVGWKGLINDPHMDGSFDVEAGLQIARKLLLELVNMGLPLARVKRQIRIARNTWAICLAGQQLVLVQRNRKLTVKWPPGFPCRLVLKTAPTAVWQQQLTLCAPPPSRTVLLALTRQGRLRCYRTRGIQRHVILRGGKAPNYSPADVAQ